MQSKQRATGILILLISSTLVASDHPSLLPGSNEKVSSEQGVFEQRASDRARLLTGAGLFLSGVLMMLIGGKMMCDSVTTGKPQ